MPYVPSEKTDGKSQDRNLINAEVEKLSKKIVDNITTNYSVFSVLTESFRKIGFCMLRNIQPAQLEKNYAWDEIYNFTNTIFLVGEKYKYEGAFLGELNYAITRVIQRVPQMLAEEGKCGLVKGKELRYWLYAMIVDSLISTSRILGTCSYGIAGVFADVKDEYKVRVNKSYEIEQILKSGDCYDTPYFNKVVEVVDEDGGNIGYTYIELKNDGKNVLLDKMPFKIVVKNDK